MDDVMKPQIPDPYTGPNVTDGIDEIFVQDAFANDDERLWVPLAPGRWSRPLCLNVSQGYWVHLTKVVGGGFLSRHRHPDCSRSAEGHVHEEIRRSREAASQEWCNDNHRCG